MADEQKHRARARIRVKAEGSGRPLDFLAYNQPV